MSQSADYDALRLRVAKAICWLAKPFNGLTLWAARVVVQDRIADMDRPIPPDGTEADYLRDGSPEAVALVRQARGLPPITTVTPPG